MARDRRRHDLPIDNPVALVPDQISGGGVARIASSASDSPQPVRPSREADHRPTGPRGQHGPLAIVTRSRTSGKPATQ